MELSEFIKNHKKFFETGDSNNDIILLEDIRDHLKEEIKWKEFSIDFLLSEINMICWCHMNAKNKFYEHDHYNLWYEFFSKLESEINDIIKYNDGILLQYFSESLDEKYHNNIFSDFGFPNSFDEFISDYKYLKNFLEKEYENG